MARKGKHVCGLCQGRYLPKRHDRRTCPLNKARSNAEVFPPEDDRVQPPPPQQPEDVAQGNLNEVSNDSPFQVSNNPSEEAEVHQPVEDVQEEVEEVPMEVDDVAPAVQEAPVDIVPFIPEDQRSLIIEDSRMNVFHNGSLADPISGNPIQGRFCDATIGQNRIVPFELVTEERRALFQLCQSFGLLLRDIVSQPGDCLYILVKVLLSLPDSITQMRHKVHEALLRNLNEEDWAPTDEGGPQTYEEYLASVLLHGYGDQFVWKELCRIYRFNYSIIRADGFIAQSLFEPNNRRIYSGFLPRGQHYVPAFPMVKTQVLEGERPKLHEDCFQHNLRMVPELALPFSFLNEVIIPEWANANTVRLVLPRAQVTVQRPDRLVEVTRGGRGRGRGRPRTNVQNDRSRSPLTRNRRARNNDSQTRTDERSPVRRESPNSRREQNNDGQTRTNERSPVRPESANNRRAQPTEQDNQTRTDASFDVEPPIVEDFEDFADSDSNGTNVVNVLIGPGTIRKLPDYRSHYTSKVEGTDKCAQCSRVSTEAMKLTFKRVMVRSSAKKWGKLKGKKGIHNLCQTCQEWIVRHKGLDYAWAAQIYTILAEDHSRDEAERLMAFIPWRWRQSWQSSVQEFSLHVQELWNLKSRIRDVTIEKKRFITEVHSGNLKLWNAAINRVPIETVVCPLGCHCHYIETMGKKFMDLFLAVAKKEEPKSIFNSRRSDWPYRGNVLDWEVSSGLEIIDDIPNILFCQDHPDSELRKEFIHVPRHPITSATWISQDNLAPAAVVPTVVRNPKLKNWTSSTHVVNEFGGYNGLSSFTLVPDGTYESEINFHNRQDELARCHRLVFERRPDVAAQYVQRDLGLEDMRFCLQMDPPISTEAIQAARQGATFVSLQDATEGWKSAVFNDGQNEHQISKSHSLVHPCPPDDDECVGHPTIQLPFQKQTPMLITMILNSIVHCPPLSHLFLEKLIGTRDNFLKTFHNILLAITTHRTLFQKNLKSFISSWQRLGLQQTAIAFWNRIQPVPGFALVEACDLLPENEDAFRDHSVFIVCNDDSGADEDDLPLHINQFYLQGVYREKNGRFRWQETFNFQLLEQDGGDESDWLWAIYAKKESTQEVLNLVKKSLSSQCEFVQCNVHFEPLSKIKRQPDSKCSVVRCRNLVSYRCLQGFPEDICQVGVCARHAKELESRKQPCYINASVPLPTTTSNNDENNSHSSSEDDDDDAISNASDEFPFNNDDVSSQSGDIDELNVLDMATGNNQEDNVDNEQIPLYTTSDVPVVHDVLNKHLPSHFFINGALKVMRRKNFGSNQTTHPIINHITSRVSGNSLALVYPEALLFPTTFWDTVPQAQAVTGALPSCMFFQNVDSDFLKHLGSLNEHLKVRIRDKFADTGRSPVYIHFVFDVLVNQVFKKSTTSIFRDKGLEFIPQVRNMSKSFETSLSFDEVTASLKKKELAHLIREGKWDYFLTITCNDALSPGVSQISKAIAHRHIINDVSAKVRLLQECQPLMVSCWRRTVNLFFDYLLESKENMLGDVDKIFMRWEFQSAGAFGNKPHVHCGLTLKGEPIQETVDRVVCILRGLIGDTKETTEEGLIDLGLLDDDFEWGQLIDLTKIQQHNCASAQGRCMKRINEEGETVCRVPVHPDSEEYFYENVPTTFDEQASDILKDLGLLSVSNDGKVELDPELQGGRWHYPSYGYQERAIPTVPLLFALFKSSTNVQVCDRRFQVAYLVKYATKSETHAFVKAKGQTDVEGVAMEKEPVRNLGFATDARAERKKQQKDQKKKKEAVVREVAYTEVLWQVCQYDYVRTNVEFVHVSTQPPESRSQTLKFSNRGSQDSSRSQMPLYVERENLNDEGQFSDEQKMFIDEFMQSNYIVDKTSRFNVRAPELCLFDNLLLFYKLFTKQAKPYPKDKVLPVDLSARPWVDGLGGVWRIRRTMLALAIDHLERKQEQGSQFATVLLETIFLPLQEQIESNDFSFERSFFVDENCSEHIIVVPSMIRPFSFVKLFYHLCLSMGSMTTEMDFMSQTSILESLQAVGLVPADQDEIEGALQSLFKQYVTTELMYAPVSNSVFQHMLKAADVFFKALRNNEIACDPSDQPIFESDLAEDSRRRLKLNQDERRTSILLAIRGSGIQFPDELIDDPNSSCVSWDPQISPFPNQVPESVDEQRNVMNICKNAIDRKIAGEPFTRFPIIVGPPGTGKTHLMMRAVTYAIAQNLKVNVLSMTGERARALGGQHVHLAFSYPVDTGISSSASITTANCLGALQNNPMKVALLAETDVFFFDELSMISAELFSSLDFIMQKIMDCSLPWGGKLVIATGDHKQLSPIQGHPLWTSPHMLTTFNLVRLTNYVRCAEDPMLQRVIELIRLSNPSSGDKAELNDTLSTSCQFVDSWDDVPLHAMRVVSTRKGEERVMKEFVSKLEADRVAMHSFDGIDEVENATGNWLPASVSASKVISKEVLEPKNLVLYEGALVRLTYNKNTAPVFSQGQLAIVVELPNSNVNPDQQKLGLRLVPPGVTDIENQQPDWPVVYVSRRVTPSVLIRGQMQQGRRTQWPVRLHAVSTIHRIIGSTCPLLATRIASDDPNFNLWEKEQLLVLISRVPRLSSLIFVGSQNSVLATVMSVMNIFSPWKYHVDCLMDKMNHQHQVEYRANVQDPIELENWRDFFRRIPAATAGYVYLIVSQTRDEAYVGQTINFVARLKQHRTGHGANSTKHRRDWHCLALVTGFQSRGKCMKSERLEVEQTIHHRIALRSARLGNLSPMQMLEIVQAVVAEKNNEEEFNGRLVVSVYTEMMSQAQRIMDPTPSTTSHNSVAIDMPPSTASANTVATDMPPSDNPYTMALDVIGMPLASHKDSVIVDIPIDEENSETESSSVLNAVEKAETESSSLFINTFKLFLVILAIFIMLLYAIFVVLVFLSFIH